MGVQKKLRKREIFLNSHIKGNNSGLYRCEGGNVHLQSCRKRKEMVMETIG